MAERIRGWREHAGMSQRDMAEKTGVSQAAISLIERGYVGNGKTFYKICDVLGKTAEEIHAMMHAGELVIVEKCHASQEDFRAFLTQQAQVGPVDVMTVRDTPINYDERKISLYLEALRLSPQVRISVLFSHPDTYFKRSFLRMASILSQKDADSGARLSGFFRHSHTSGGFPILHPSALVLGNQDPQERLFVGCRVSEIQGKLPSESLTDTLLLELLEDPVMTQQFVNSIGLLGRSRLDPAIWQQIEC